MKAVLEGYFSYVHCDVGSAYRQLEKAKLVGCWAHVRRKFFEATPKKADKTSLGATGLSYCDRQLSLEGEWEALSAEERLHKRRTESAPLMDEFFNWFREQAFLPGAKLGTALAYSLKFKKVFRNVLSDGNLFLSNNLAERAIKTLVMGRSETVQWTVSA